jgi:hypothetical protein
LLTEEIADTSPQVDRLLRDDALYSSGSLVAFQRTKVHQCYSFLMMEVTLSLKTMIMIKNGVFWDVTPCGSCKN